MKLPLVDVYWHREDSVFRARFQSQMYLHIFIMLSIAFLWVCHRSAFKPYEPPLCRTWRSPEISSCSRLIMVKKTSKCLILFDILWFRWNHILIELNIYFDMIRSFYFFMKLTWFEKNLYLIQKGGPIFGWK